MAVITATVDQKVRGSLMYGALLHGITAEFNGDTVSLVGDVAKVSGFLARFYARQPARTVSDVKYYDCVEITYAEATSNIGIKAPRLKRL